MIDKKEIENLCKSALTETQFLVEIKISNNNDIFVTIDDFNGLNIEECRRISRFIEENLDRDKEDFSIEVSSPGLSNPFKVPEQYQKSLNKEVEVILKTGEKITGTLTTIRDDEIIISYSYFAKMANKKQQISEISKIKFKDIKSTKSVISFK
ncbi:MAG: ribosome assembly cofactor RimP [Bacteroidales bacterium]|jgi:ribosome maturation factor RimP|nr:ribosome assembly cofactor RimP [Bacteroidales bacterium]NLP19174.1 ribosome assembly cofactor RimP [Bacteroidales bacterium]HOD88120.1 ribosome assembly cofactor RimP [Bacteroidales bacterium]